MKDNDYYVISVESRKGGVGKTTAALNLAKLFIDRGYAVLFLDADITGTNVGYSINSPFWKDIVNVFKEKDTPENLLEWFERKFMCGAHLPEFTKKIDPGKINIIGSQVFEERKTEKNNKQATKDALICSPSILFDKLHSFWFIEFIKKICKEFAHLSEKASVIIIDNSPGFVGIAPAIHEWLTDMGPKRGKFLTVSSLDEQDIASCCHAVNNIHRTLLNKIETAHIFENIRSNKDGSISPEYHAFFLRLLEEYEEDKNNEQRKNHRISKELEFYLSDQWKKTEYSEKPSSYQNWILNRVPREVERGVFQYNADAILGKDDSFSKLPMKIWNSSGGRSDVIPQNQMVSFDEYIEYQFLHNLTSSTRRYQRRHPRAEKAIHLLFARYGQNELDGFLYDNIDFSYEQYKKTTDYLKISQSYIEEVLERLSRLGFSNLTRLMRKEWYPMYPFRNLQDTFYNMTLEAKYPPLEFVNYKYEEGYGRTDKRINSNIKDFDLRLKTHLDEKALHEIPHLLKKSFLTAISYVFSSFQWHEPVHEEMMEWFASLLKIEASHRERKMENKLTLQAFLASDNITEKEYYEHGKKIFHFIEHSWWHDNYSTFYRSICQTQARLIDLQEDTEFLIYVLKEVIATSKEELPLSPYIRPLLEKVIEKKTLTHEQGRKQCAKGFKEASYMEEFQEILAGVIDKWGISKNGI